MEEQITALKEKADKAAEKMYEESFKKFCEKEENAEKFGNEYNIPNRFYSYKAMAKSDAIDVAYIAVPHSGHADCSILMMNNKKHMIQLIS